MVVETTRNTFVRNTMPNRDQQVAFVDQLKRFCLTVAIATVMFLAAPTYDPRSVGYATPTPGDISTRIEQLTGLSASEIDQIYAGEQAANVLLIAYEVTIPVLLEERIGYLLIRQASTGNWIRMIVPTIAEWDTDFRPYLESQGVEIHRQPYGTIDSMTPAAEAAAIAAAGSIPGSANANLVLHGDVAGPSGTIPTPTNPAGPSAPPLANYPDIDSVGTTASNFRVDESGAATYSVPIAVAAGTADVAPRVSLNYSSSAGNGIAGMGWSIGGLSAISRCRQTYDQDRDATAISFSSADPFCLDGQRLLKTSGTHGVANATYRTELDNGAIVTIEAVSNGEPDYFKVERKDGSTSYYGKAPGDSNTSAKLGDGVGRTLTWSIRVFSDSFAPNGNEIGNPIWFFYETSGGGQRISEIRWAYGTGRGPAGHNAHVEFLYDATARADAISGYVDGALFYNNKRLQTIKSYNNGAEIRRYNLDYQDGVAFYDTLSRLKSIEECLGTVCLPKTNFDWRYPLIAASVQNLATFTMSGGITSFQPGDIDGDGRMDLVWITGSGANTKLRYALSYGSGYTNQSFAAGGTSLNIANAVDLRPIDYNLDGRQDVMFYDTVIDRWKVVLAEPYGNAQWRLVSTPITTPLQYRSVVFSDIDSNGTTDAIYSKDTNNEYIYFRYLELDPSQSNSSARRYHFGSEVTIQPTGASESAGDVVAVSPDFNGDGQVDVIMHGEFDEECEVTEEDEVCTPIVNNYALTIDGINQTPTVTPYYSIPGDNEASSVDINGDGLSDLVRPQGNPGSFYSLRYSINKGDGTFTGTTIVDSSLVDNEAQREFTDWNMDGYADLIWREKIGSNTSVNVRYWTPGAAGSAGSFGGKVTVATFSGWSNAESVLYFDVNGDAVTDIVRINKNGNAGSVEVRTRWTNSSATALANVAVNKIDGITNGLGAKTTIAYEPLSTTNHYERLELAVSTTPGTFCEDVGDLPGQEIICYDNPIHVTDKSSFYEALNGDWGYPSSWQSLDKTSPVLELAGPLYVVTSVAGDAPKAGASRGNILIGAASTLEYFYGEAKLQAAGRGFLGFQRLTTNDLQSDVVTTTRYRQDWPFIGMPISTEVVATDGNSFAGDTISTSSNEWEIYEWTNSSAASGGTAAMGPLHLVQTKSTDKTYDLTVAGSLLSSVVTTSDYNAEGYPTQIIAETSDAAGVLKTVTTTNKYEAPGFALIEGRLSETTVATTYNSDAGQKTASLVTTFGYYGDTTRRGLLETESIVPGPGTPTAQLAPSITTTHDYDGYGNRDESAVTSDGATRCSGIQTSVYDSTGRYVDITKDCLGRTTSSVEARSIFGAPEQVKTYLNTSGPSAVTTTTAYSVLGREYYQHTSDGAAVTTYLTSNLSNCPVSSVLKSVTESDDGAVSQVCTDKLGREVRTLTRGFDGAWDVQDTEYDEFGRVAFKSEPYDLGSSAYWTSIVYDQLGRPTTTTLPDTSSSTTSYTYVSSSHPQFSPDRPGLLTTITNDALEERHEITNAVGERTDVIDNNDGRTSFVYDALGNLVSTTDAGNATSSMTYDVFGRKKTMNDPDKGSWSYEYSGFGEVIKQIDARSQVQVIAYDGLGRMICRRDERVNFNPTPGCTDAAGSNTTGIAIWTYDTAPDGLGQVANVADSISGYQRIFSYDNKGRVSEVDTTIDSQTYSEKTTYDQFGRIYQVFDAAGDGSFTDQGVVHDYNANGYLYRVGDAVQVGGAPRTVYRHITAMNARGQVEVETLGDGVVTTDYDYYAQTGRMWTIKSTSAWNSYDVQDLEYQWDTLGNLNYRKEMSGSKNLTESFEYTDGMNRLTKYTVSGQSPVIVSYLANGNIENKSDVGSADYQYGTSSVRPHAVVQAGGQSYGYDANGNNTTGDGRTISYTVFDKPSSIDAGAFSIEFEYGPDRARYKRTDTETGNNPTVTRYLGNVEIIDRSDGTHERKRYIAGIAIETIHYGTNTVEDFRQTHYQFKDHLGSLDVLTNSSGEIAQELSFDPWGKRRNATNWTALTGTSLSDFDTSITTRGFTGHEMLDKVGIVHMNGRIYDSKLGRFLQADPFVQDVGNTQSTNRYSYVLNNPLNATDPSGFIIFTLAAVFAVAADLVAAELVAALFALASAADTLLAGGSLSDALIAGLSGLAFSGLAGNLTAASVGFNLQTAATVVAYGAIGGITSVLQGGKFGDGFRSAAITGALGGLGAKISNGMGNLGKAATKIILGGTSSELTGGKFVNGAASVAAVYAVQGIAAVGKPFVQAVGKAMRGVRTWLAKTVWPSHYERNAINEQNLRALGLWGIEGATPEILTGEGLQLELTDYDRKVYHDFGPGNEGNQRWVYKEPHPRFTDAGLEDPFVGTELVVDAAGNHVMDQPQNAASYNRAINGFGHALKDVVPYMLFGNSPSDSTNIFQRMSRTMESPRRRLLESPATYGQ